ncbi:MAG: putative glycosyl hydrolase [Pseudonocardiales bacterium]|nr:putative glycosyl hydrolase [Pseudonocardiales bacterium]
MTVLEVWAPKASTVRVRRLDSAPSALEPAKSGTDTLLLAEDGGWFRGEVTLSYGQDYGILLDDSEDLLPDPRSRWQPYGVHGPSRLHDPRRHTWGDASWTGRTLAGAVIYELHIGTFTPGGTFDSAVERLDHLVDLGITHVEVLPVAGVNGSWNWGYDGVDWYAVHDPYGGPDAFKRFIDACHRRGLAVVLDVVYNHFGPSGNYLPLFGPYLKQGSNTWGDLVNFDGPESSAVRRFVIDNVLMWFAEYRIDALRLDAVHAMEDQSAFHILEEIAAEVDAASAAEGRPLTLIAESDLNDVKLITPREAGGYGLNAQWDDDVHHCLHALLTGERQGYYGDFGSIGALAKVLTRAFFHDGTWSSFRGRTHGRPVDRSRVPGYRFVVCLQNHDQVGNRATGDRLPAITDREMLRVGALLLLTSPFTPMLWMGEEWGATTPWRFFTSHPEPELAEATAKGRIAEFAEHGWDPANVPDPQDPDTFESSKLDWSEPEQAEHAELLALYQALTALRRDVPELADPRLDRISVDFDEQQRWMVIHRGRLRIAVNLAAHAQTVPLDAPAIDVMLATEPGFVFGPDLARGENSGPGITLAAQSGAIVNLVPHRPGPSMAPGPL